MRRYGIVAAALGLAVSCSAPSSVETFIKAEEASNGSYRFGINMADSLGVYDFDFYTRMDGRSREAFAPLEVTWISPSLKRFSETVYLDLEGSSNTFYSRQIHVPYRKGVSMKELGYWTIEVSLPQNPGLTGLGLICTKVK